MVKETTTLIQVSIETWQRLKAKRTRPSHTFDEIISSTLDEIEESQNENN